MLLSLLSAYFLVLLENRNGSMINALAHDVGDGAENGAPLAPAGGDCISGRETFNGELSLPHLPGREAQASASLRDSASRRQFLWIYFAIAGSLLFRASLLDFESGDYRMFLSRGYDFFVEHGRWHGLGLISEQFHASYPPLFLYLLSLSTLLPVPKLYAIKLISIAADYLAAWFVWRLVHREFPYGRRPWAAVALFLFLPTVVMNGALWGQRDITYTCGFLASLFYILERRPVAALVAFGLSCSLKAQAMFWLPFLLGLLVCGRLRWKWVWVPAAVYAACGVPQMLAGRPILHVLGHWGRARGEMLPGLTLGATNWYQWVFEQCPEVFWYAGIVLALVATAFLVLWMREDPRLAESRWLVSFAFLSVLFMPFLLPGMHERYFFPADVLAVVYAFYVPGGWRAAVLIQFASAFTYLPFLFGREPVPRTLLALAVLAAIGLVLHDLIWPNVVNIRKRCIQRNVA